MIDHERLANILVEFCGQLVTDYRVGDMLERLCEATVEILEVDGAGVMLEDDDGHLRFVAASDEVVCAIEELQIELGEGPCLHAYRSGEAVRVDDLDTAPHRFPRFGPRAVDAGMRAVWSLPMRLADERVGALNLYRAQAGPFADDQAEIGQVLADVATTAILNARGVEDSQRLTTQLQHALDSRIVIEQAKGKASEQLGVSPTEAFEHLRRYARGRGLKLHAVAADVVEDRLRMQTEGA